MEEKKEKFIIEGNAVYEVDLECLKKKEKAAEERKKKQKSGRRK